MTATAINLSSADATKLVVMVAAKRAELVASIAFTDDTAEIRRINLLVDEYEDLHARVMVAAED